MGTREIFRIFITHTSASLASFHVQRQTLISNTRMEICRCSNRFLISVERARGARCKKNPGLDKLLDFRLGCSREEGSRGRQRRTRSKGRKREDEGNWDWRPLIGRLIRCLLASPLSPSLSLTIPLFFSFLPICRSMQRKNLSSSSPLLSRSFPTGYGQIAREKPIYRPLRIEEVSRLNWRG